MAKNITVITGSRAEYGILYPLLNELQQEPAFKLTVVATGSHLSPEFGLTYKEIESDGFDVFKIETLMSSDTPVAVSKSMGLCLSGFADAYQILQPDLVIVVGDRFEIFSCVAAALVARIPIAHIHGGEVTEGAFDESFRHSITKMSHFHFASTEIYRNRILQLGENPDHVFNVGALGIDNIKNTKLLSKSGLEKSLDITLKDKTILVTFHPVTLENNTSESQMKDLLAVLRTRVDNTIIFTKTNADTHGRIINELIDAFVEENPNSYAFFSVGRVRYLSLVQLADIVLGNSSSGIIEVPSFKTATINIGDRQKGRVRTPSIIDCEPTASSIQAALTKAYSATFQKLLEQPNNPHDQGGAAKLIIKQLKQLPDSKQLLKKKFFDQA